MTMKGLRLTLTDALAAALLTAYVVCRLRGGGMEADARLYGILVTALIYVTLRCVFHNSSTLAQAVMLVAYAVWGCREAILGMLQLAGKRASENALFTLTGSFPNPGPLGGFLAVFLAMCISWLAMKHDGWRPMRLLMGASVAVCTPVLLLSGSRAALLALACGLLGASAFIPRWRHFIGRHLLLLSLLAVLAGAGAYALKRGSADSRFITARISLRAMSANGLHGAGLGRFGRAYADAQARFFEARASSGVTVPAATARRAACPEFAFNEFLHAGVEAGPATMLLMLALFASALVNLYRKQSFMFSGMTALLLFVLLSYPFSLWQFRPVLAALLAGGATSEERAVSGHAGTVTAFVALASLFTLVVLQTPWHKAKLEARQQFESLEFAFQNGSYENAVRECEKLWPYLQDDPKYLFEYGQALSKSGLYERSDSVLEMGTRISADPMFWNVMGRNSQERGLYDEARIRYRHAYLMLPDRLYPLCLLARLSHEEGDSQTFLRLAAEINRFHPKVESDLTKSLRHEIQDLLSTYE